MFAVSEGDSELVIGLFVFWLFLKPARSAQFSGEISVPSSLLDIIDHPKNLQQPLYAVKTKDSVGAPKRCWQL